MSSDEETTPSFLKPAQVAGTALGVTVAIAWNDAVRKVVDDFVGTNESENSVLSAVLITVVVILLYFLMNAAHDVASGFISAGRDVQDDFTAKTAIGPTSSLMRA